MVFLETIVPGILTLSILVSTIKKNKLTMPLAIFLIVYVGFIL